jgi:hypothetical protein
VELYLHSPSKALLSGAQLEKRHKDFTFTFTFAFTKVISAGENMLNKLVGIDRIFHTDGEGVVRGKS